MSSLLSEITHSIQQYHQLPFFHIKFFLVLGMCGKIHIVHSFFSVSYYYYSNMFTFGELLLNFSSYVITLIEGYGFNSL